MSQDWNSFSDRGYVLPSDVLVVFDTTDSTGKNVTAPHLFGGADWTGGQAALSGASGASSGRGVSAYFSHNSGGSAIMARVDHVAGGLASFFYGASTPVGSITTNGTATAYNTTSDYRLKDNFRPVVDPIKTLMKLKPGTFEWISTGKTTDGFLAHEFGRVIPGACHGKKDAVEDIGTAAPPAPTDARGNALEPIVDVPKSGAPKGWIWTKTGQRIVPQGIDQSKAVPLLVAALQAAIKRIEALEMAAVK